MWSLETELWRGILAIVQIGIIFALNRASSIIFKLQEKLEQLEMRISVTETKIDAHMLVAEKELERIRNRLDRLYDVATKPI